MKKDVLSLTRSLVRPAHQVISFQVSEWDSQSETKTCSPSALINHVEVVKNGAGSLQQFEMEKDYYIQKQKDEIALLRSQVIIRH